MSLDYLVFWFKWKKVIIPFTVIAALFVGYTSSYVTNNTIASPQRDYYGSMKTITLPELASGCTDSCADYLIDTAFQTRISATSQLEALFGGTRSTYSDAALYSGFGGTLVTAEGTLVSDLVSYDSAWSTISKRILSGVATDLNNDGYNEFIYGLNSYNVAKLSGDTLVRQGLSFEIIAAYSDDPDDYKSVSNTLLNKKTCELGTTCAAKYRWAIDGDITNVVSADFNSDGWNDIAYMGLSLGDHSWIGTDDALNSSTGAPYLNENGARVGVALNAGYSKPGALQWPGTVSPIETYLANLYPYNNNIAYSPKMHKLTAADMDDDGNVDIVLTGDKLIVAWGDGDGTFKNIQTISDTPGGVDSSVADFNNDGILDIFVLADSMIMQEEKPRKWCKPLATCMQLGESGSGLSALYTGSAPRKYEKAHELGGVKRPTSISSIDVNNDGWLDIVFTCDLCDGPVLERAQSKDGKLDGYNRGSLTGKVGSTMLKRSLVTDVDDDGDMDILFSGSGASFRQLWVNTSKGNWVKIKIVGASRITGETGSALSTSGIAVTITGEFGIMSSITTAGSNYVFFSLGNKASKSVDSVNFKWPGNATTTIVTNIPVNKTTTILEQN